VTLVPVGIQILGSADYVFHLVSPVASYGDGRVPSLDVIKQAEMSLVESVKCRPQPLDLGAEFVYMISQLVIFRTGQGESLASHNGTYIYQAAQRVGQSAQSGSIG
jgi:hypothetical protein